MAASSSQTRPVSARDRQILRQRAAELGRTEHQEIFNILQRHGVTYSRNSNGVFVNLSLLPDVVIQEMERFVDFCVRNKNSLDEYEKRLTECKMSHNYTTLDAAGVPVPADDEPAPDRENGMQDDVAHHAPRDDVGLGGCGDGRSRRHPTMPPHAGRACSDGGPSSSVNGRGCAAAPQAPLVALQPPQGQPLPQPQQQPPPAAKRMINTTFYLAKKKYARKKTAATEKDGGGGKGGGRAAAHADAEAGAGLMAEPYLM